MKKFLRLSVVWLLLLAMICMTLASCNDETDEAPAPETEAQTPATDFTESAETDSDTVKPEDSETETVKPEDSETETVKPEDSETEAAKPENSETEAAKPEESESDMTEPENSESDSEIPEAKPMESDLLKYQILYTNSDGSVAKGFANTLFNTMKENGHDMTSVQRDTAVREKQGALEILIGSTNRAASTAALANMTEANQFVIAFDGSKIVITAKAKLNIPVAIDYFLKNYVDLEAGTVNADDGDVYVGSVEMVELAAEEDGVKTSKYAIIRGISGSFDTLAYNLYNMFKSRVGDENVKYLDDGDARPADVNLILVGNDINPDKYPEIKEITANWGLFEYGFAKVGDHLIVAANIQQSGEKAISLAQTQITREAEWVDGKLMMKFVEDLRETDDRYLSDFPQFDKELLRFYYNNDNEMAYEYKKVTKAEFDAYVAALEAAGYVKQNGGYQIGRNHFATCVHPEKGQVHVTYFPAAIRDSGDMTIFTTKLEVTSAIPTDTYDPTTDKLTETVFHVMSQDYTNRGEMIWDGNGLNYIVTLEDGRFVIFDGGYANCSDADNIYRYMQEMNLREDGKIVIAAWFMSHPHADHHGAFDTFMAKYYNDVTIEYFVANSPTEEYYGDKHWMITTMPSLLKKGNIKLIKPHTGQVLTFCGTKFEILLTHETVLGAYGGGNDACTVVRIIENGHSILLSADASGGMCAKMISLYGDALKSDILQLNHHGVSGGTTAFYQAVDPTYALWTTSEDAFSVYKGGRINGGGNCGGTAPESNRWIRDNVGKENCFVADDEIEQIFMPEGGEIRIETDTGYRVTNAYPAGEGDGKLQVPSKDSES